MLAGAVSQAAFITAVGTILGAMILAAGSIIAVTLGNRKRNSAENHDIHVLVNQRLTDALDEISGLREALGIQAADPIPEPKEIQP